MAIPPATCSPDRACPSRGRGGFTLIEVLITLVILSTGIVVVLQAFQTSATALGASRDALYANHLLNVTMDELEQVGGGGVTGNQVFSPPFDHFRRLVTEQRAEEVSPGLMHLTVEVWRDGSSAVFKRDLYRAER
ncbi:MAG: prepilin-type N-terminal cleavage/methylation domain-containing protein [Lentisphaerae bacterium]|nr:prepilin-type N-terminal cleavage/methylation domain-containing protein [Lentisphaerota bacterium]